MCLKMAEPEVAKVVVDDEDKPTKDEPNFVP